MFVERETESQEKAIDRESNNDHSSTTHYQKAKVAEFLQGILMHG